MIPTTQQTTRRPKSSGPRPFTQPKLDNERIVPTARGVLPILTPSERAARRQAHLVNSNATIPIISEDSYTCPELRRNPGIESGRFAAYALPSRTGDWLRYPRPDGRVLPVPGSKADKENASPP